MAAMKPQEIRKYKVGDIVTIRSDLMMKKEYPMHNTPHTTDGVTSEMLAYKGKKAKITAVYSKYDIDLDDGQHSWTDTMFQKRKSINDLCRGGV